MIQAAWEQLVSAPMSPPRDSSRHHIGAPLFVYLRFTAEKKKKRNAWKGRKEIKLSPLPRMVSTQGLPGQ